MFAGLALVVAAGTVQAQSLAVVARQEAARRQTVKEPAKVYTNQNLGTDAIHAPAPAAAEPAGDAAAAAGDKPEAAAGDPKAQAAKDQQYWRDRITKAREDLARTEVLRAALESRVSALQTDFVNRDNPVERAQIAKDQQEARDELARMDQQLKDLQKAITDIQEEARKAGVPAGWLR